jgi:hypothetical protein
MGWEKTTILFNRRVAMNILKELAQRGTEYQLDDSGHYLRIVDAEGNLGVVLAFDRFEFTYHFWDANGCSYSPDYPFISLDELFNRFDRLILIYYCDDNPQAFETYFADWKLIECEA